MFREQLENDKKRAQVRNEMADMMMEILLESDMPEYEKIDLRIIKAALKLKETIGTCLVERYVIKNCNPDDYEFKKNLLEYIQMVEVGVKQFAEANPVKGN